MAGQRSNGDIPLGKQLANELKRHHGNREGKTPPTSHHGNVKCKTLTIGLPLEILSYCSFTMHHLILSQLKDVIIFHSESFDSESLILNQFVDSLS